MPEMSDTTAQSEPSPVNGDGWEWAIVEIFGHRRHAGRTREEERFGAKMLRIDIPVKGDPAANGWQTHYYGGSSIFSFSLSDEDSVMHINKPCEPASRLTYWQKGAEDAEFSAPKEDDL